jgi:hypothetical protein
MKVGGEDERNTLKVLAITSVFATKRLAQRERDPYEKRQSTEETELQPRIGVHLIKLNT